MKSAGYQHQELSSNHGLPPTQGFRLVDSVQLNPRQVTSNTSSPVAPFSGSSPSRTPQERRQHLIQVLECAMAILEDDDFEDLNNNNDTTFQVPLAPNAGRNDLFPRPPTN